MNSLRKLFHGITVATVSVVIVATGAAAVAVAATSSDPLSSPDPALGTEATDIVSVDVGTQITIPVSDIGMATVTRTGAGLKLVSAVSEPGWQVLVEVATGLEVEVSFRSDGIRHDLNVELEDGQVRVRIRTQAGQIEDSGGSTTTTPGSSASTSTTLPDTSSSTSTSTMLPPAPAGDSPQDMTVLDAGTVTYAVDGSQLKIVGVSPNGGWSPTVEVPVGREVELSFRNGSARVDLNLELEDSQVRIRIRDRRTEARTEVRVPANGSNSDSTNSSTISTAPRSAGSETTAPTQHTVSSAGGSVVVSVSGDTVLLVGTNPNAGYAAEIREAGPDEVDVRFESGNAESRIEVRARDGRTHKDVEDR